MNETRVREPIATIYICRESSAISIDLDTMLADYSEHIPGEGADIALARSIETNKLVGARLPLYAKTLVIAGEDIGPITIDLKTGRVIMPQPNPERDFVQECNEALAAKDAKIAELQASLNEALKQVGEWSRKCGLAEGRLAASEMAGVVEDWRQRAEKAEAELAREREISRDAIDQGDEAAAILHGDPNYRWTFGEGCGEVVELATQAVADCARLRLLLAPWSAESGECWQCHCQRRGMQHTNGKCRCSPEWKAAVRKA